MTDHGTIHAIVLQQKHWSIVRQTQRRGEAKLADYESVRGGRWWSAPRSPSNRRTWKVQLDKRGERKYRKRPVLCAVSARYFVISRWNQGNSETRLEKTEEFLWLDFYDSTPALPLIFWNFPHNSRPRAFVFLPCEPEVGWFSNDDSPRWRLLSRDFCWKFFSRYFS